MAAGYDIFTNIQGPSVPVSLYGDAATAGINAGNALPTTATAIIQGGLKGVQQGQEIVATEQQNEIRANQIEQIPVQNARQKAALDADLTANRINAVKANIVEQNADAMQQEQLAQLNYQKQAFEEKSRSATAYADYTKEISSLDPVSFKDNVLSGKYDAVYADNPKAYNKALQDMYLNQTKNGLAQDPVTLGAIGTLLKKSNAISSLDKLAEQNRQAAAQNEALVLQSTLTDNLSSKLDGDPRDFPNQVKIAQQGKYIQDPTTHAIMKNDDGSYVENTPANRALYKVNQGEYDPKSSAFFAYNPTTGEILSDNVSPDDAKLYSAAVKFNKLMSGQTARSTAESIQSDFRNALSKARQESTPGQDATPPGYDAVAQKTLGVGPEVVAKIKPSLNDLDKQASIYISSPESRNSPAAVSAQATAISNTARAIAEHNFESNPDLKRTYNDDAVLKWNADLDKQIAYTEANKPGAFSRFMNSINPFDISVELYNFNLSALQAAKAASPLDLYYHTQSKSLQKSVETFFNKLVQAKSLVADRNSNNIRATAATSNYLASIRKAP